MTQNNENEYEASPIWSGLRCRCPRCGKGKLFAGYLKIAKKCNVCDMDFSSAEDADGPAVFGILIVGIVVAFSALIVEVKFSPPTWVHMTLWIPLSLIGSLGVLQPLKGIFVVMQLKHGAKEGQQFHDGE